MVQDQALEDALEAWLQPGKTRLNPAFPPMLEAMFAAETADAKLRTLRVNTLVGLSAGLLITPVLWLVLQDAHSAILHIWLGITVPIGIACCMLLWVRIPVRWQERQSAVCGGIVAVGMTVLMASSRANVEGMYFGGLLLLMMLNVVAGGFGFLMGLSFVVGMLVVFATGVQYLAGFAGLQGWLSAVMFAVCCIFVMCGAWRVETAVRRSWALMLRERLKRRALADSNSELAEQAQRDALTGLANRRAYELFESVSWRRALDAGMTLGLIVIDIDRFKDYNDFYGHPAGDACLQSVARCLSEQLRGAGDLVARVGGEEFAILLPELTLETAGDIAERVRQAVAALELPHLGWGAGRIVTVSCGACSLVPDEDGSPKDLFSAADAALYAAKQSGRNRVCLANLPDAPARAGPRQQAAGLDEVSAADLGEPPAVPSRWL